MTLSTKSQISVHLFTARYFWVTVHAVLIKVDILTPWLPWTLQGQRYSLYAVLAPLSPKFQSVSLYANIFKILANFHFPIGYNNNCQSFFQRFLNLNFKIARSNVFVEGLQWTDVVKHKQWTTEQPVINTRTKTKMPFIFCNVCDCLLLLLQLMLENNCNFSFCSFSILDLLLPQPPVTPFMIPHSYFNCMYCLHTPSDTTMTVTETSFTTHLLIIKIDHSLKC